MAKNGKSVWKIGNVNVDEIVKAVRTITPCNRTKLREVAVLEMLRGKTIKEVALIVKGFNDSRKAGDIEFSDKVILE